MASSSGTKDIPTEGCSYCSCTMGGYSCSSCIMTNPRDTTSVFLVTDFPDYLGALFKFEIEPGGEVRGGGEVTCEHPPLIEPIIIFPDGSRKSKKPYRLLSASRLFNPSMLYLLADYTMFNFSLEPLQEPMHGYIFDMHTQALDRSNPPHGSNGCILSAYDRLYYIAATEYPAKFSSFEQYDLQSESWISLCACPLESSSIQGYAVVHGHIIISLGRTSDYALAYDIALTIWSQVPICPSPHYPFLVPRSFCGRAVIVGYTLYALSMNPGEILAYSYTRIVGGRCFLGAPFSCYLRAFPVETFDQQLVHLGSLDFCLIQRFCDGDLQKFGICTFQIILEGGMHIRTKYVSVFDVGQLESLTTRFSFRNWKDVEPTPLGFWQGMDQPKHEKALVLPEDEKVGTLIADFSKMVVSSLKVFGGGSKRILLLLDFIKSSESGVLYELKVTQGKVMGAESEMQEIPRIDSVARLFTTSDELVVQKKSFLGCARLCSSSGSNLFMFLDDGLDWPLNLNEFSPPINGSCYVFDIDRKSVVPFKSSAIGKTSAAIISAYGKVYYFVNPASWPWISGLPFLTYDPTNETWDSLPNFPLCFPSYPSTWYSIPPFFSQYRSEMEILGYAVCYGFILLSLGKVNGQWDPENVSFAYDVRCKKWYALRNCDSTHYPFRGRAVVFANTIFALSKAHGEVITFSLKVDYDDAAGIVLSLSKPFLVPWVNRRFPPLVGGLVDHGEQVHQTEAIVHLGELKFCLLQTTFPAQHCDRQCLYITSFEILNEGESWLINTLDSSIRDVSQNGGRFLIRFCFAPEFEDLEPSSDAADSLLQQWYFKTGESNEDFEWWLRRRAI